MAGCIADVRRRVFALFEFQCVNFICVLLKAKYCVPFTHVSVFIYITETYAD
jgi:hypothetical protein